MNAQDREALRAEAVVAVTGFDGSDEEVTTWVASALDSYAEAVAAPLVEALHGIGCHHDDGWCFCKHDDWSSRQVAKGHQPACLAARAALAAYEAGK